MLDSVWTAWPDGPSEREVRRRLERAGLQLKKDRARIRSYQRAGGYMVVNPSTNMLVAGERFDLTLKEAASFARS